MPDLPDIIVQAFCRSSASMSKLQLLREQLFERARRNISEPIAANGGLPHDARAAARALALPAPPSNVPVDDFSAKRSQKAAKPADCNGQDEQEHSPDALDNDHEIFSGQHCRSGPDPEPGSRLTWSSGSGCRAKLRHRTRAGQPSASQRAELLLEDGAQ